MSEPATGEPRVTVRMYRPGGLGDCFLIGLPGPEKVCHLLIDCGVFFATAGAEKRMLAIAEDIEKVTGGHLQVLAATHQHWDHLSGFHLAREIFDRLTVDQVWLAWTEDPENPEARRLRQDRRNLYRGLLAAAAHLKASGDTDNARSVEDILGFHGPFDGPLGAAGTDDLLEYLRQKAVPRYLKPAAPPLTLPGVGGARVYVLGPPTDERLLRLSRPSQARDEVYGGAAFGATNASFAEAVLSVDPPPEAAGKSGRATRGGSGTGARRDRPFDRRYVIDLAEAPGHPDHGGFFTDNYHPDSKTREEEVGYRRIDLDWLGAAGELALKLDGDTNNTSLVLAIELEKEGRVLLFPGDAQVGSWRSWNAVEWPADDGNGKPVTGEDLLRRTVLYKVGHHGSHNATLKAGLELMASDPRTGGELVALVPVDEKQAGQKRWKMPFEPLYRRLREKTRGRILRADRGLPQKRPPELAPGEWQDFRGRCSEAEDGLWVELALPFPISEDRDGSAGSRGAESGVV